MTGQKEFEKLSSYVKMYVEKVIGLKHPVLDSPSPKTLISENPVIYLPMSFESLCEFLGKEFVESADREIIFAIVIGLAYHEAGHLISGEKIINPHLLNNLICDSNDFNVVPQKWHGSIPYTLTLINTTYRQSLDIEELKLNSKSDKLQALINLAITFLRKLKIRYKGQDIRTLPENHPLHETFENMKPILKEARKAKVEKRPELVKRLHKILKQYWDQNKDNETPPDDPDNNHGSSSPNLNDNQTPDYKPGSNKNGKSKNKTSFKDALNGMSSDIKKELNVIDIEQLREIINNNRLFENIKKELQSIIDQAKIEASIKEKQETKKALTNIREYDRNHNYKIKEAKELSQTPVKVNDSIVHSLRKNLRNLLYERAVARRKASITGVKFCPGRFHEIKTNPENPRIRLDKKRMGRNLVETELLLCFDRSGSMGGDKEIITKEIAGTLYKALSGITRARINILGFDDVPIIITHKNKLPADIVLRRIPEGLCARGGTRFPMGLRESLKMLQNSPAHKKIIFMLTDGDLHGEPTVEELLRLAKILSIEVFCIGVEGSSKTEIESIFGTKNSLYVSAINELPEEIKKITLNRL